MFGLSGSGKKSLYGVLIDIASGSVGVAIVVSEKNSPLPSIIYSHRNTMRITKHGARKDENLRRIREALLSAMLTLSDEGLTALRTFDPHGKISGMYVTCSSPWSYTIARNVRYEDEEPFVVTQSIVNNLVESAETERLNHLRTNARMHEEGFEIVERATVDMTVNDYPVVNPLHLKGKMFTLSHIAGIIPKEIIASIHEVEEKLFPGTNIRAHTYMLVMYCVMRDIFPRMHSHCIIDVTGEATEFGIVENNLLIENTFIPEGSNTFVRKIMDETGKPFADIDSSMRTYGDTSTVDPEDFKKQIDAYIGSVKEAVQGIMNRRAFPSEIIITVQRPYEAFFKHMLSSAITQATGKEPTIIAIESKIIEEITHNADGDVYLALGARFFHKLHGCGEIESR